MNIIQFALSIAFVLGAIYITSKIIDVFEKKVVDPAPIDNENIDTPQNRYEEHTKSIAEELGISFEDPFTDPWIDHMLIRSWGSRYSPNISLAYQNWLSSLEDLEDDET